MRIGRNNRIITRVALAVIATVVLALGALTTTTATATAGVAGKVTVAVLDTGIDQTNRTLTDRIIAGVNFTTSTTENDINGHGTHIAGIIVRNETAVILNVKVAGDDGIVNPETVAKGIKWAADNGARVINVSLTYQESVPALEEAVSYAWEKGAVIVAAAGNNFSTTPVYPAAYQNVIAVAATDDNGQLARWSNHGEWIKATAPGVNVLSSLPGNTKGIKSGTSQAAATVSARAATLFAGGAANNTNVYQTITAK